MRAANYVLTACLLVSAWPLQAFAQAKEPTSTQVTQLFAQAHAAYGKGDLNAACEAYKAAWVLQKSYDIAGNLGGVELKLGRFRDAAEHLAFALEDFPPTGDPAQRGAVERKLETALKEVGRLHVRVSVDGATVTLNGAPMGASPVASTTYIEPGTVVVEAKLAGYVSARETVTVAKGGEAHVVLTVVPESRKPNLGLVVGGAATAAVGIGVGIGLLVAAGNKQSSADVTLSGIVHAGTQCTSPPQAGPCSDLLSLRRDIDTFHNVGVPVVVAGSVVAAGTLVYALWPRSKPIERRGQVRLLPQVGPQVGGLWLTGSF